MTLVLLTSGSRTPSACWVLTSSAPKTVVQLWVTRKGRPSTTACDTDFLRISDGKSPPSRPPLPYMLFYTSMEDKLTILFLLFQLSWYSSGFTIVSPLLFARADEWGGLNRLDLFLPLRWSWTFKHSVMFLPMFSYPSCSYRRQYWGPGPVDVVWGCSNILSCFLPMFSYLSCSYRRQYWGPGPVGVVWGCSNILSCFYQCSHTSPVLTGVSTGGRDLLMWCGGALPDVVYSSGPLYVRLVFTRWHHDRGTVRSQFQERPAG